MKISNISLSLAGIAIVMSLATSCDKLKDRLNKGKHEDGVEQDDYLTYDDRDFSSAKYNGSMDEFDASMEGPERRALDPSRDSAKMALVPRQPEQSASDDLVDRARNVGGSGDLKLTMLWDFPADVDIHVQQPNGKIINYLNKKDRGTGGYLDVDNRKGGSGAAENVFWSNPPRGTYKVWINYYGPSSANGSAGSGPVNVILIRKGEEPRTFRNQLSSIGQKVDVVTFTVD